MDKNNANSLFKRFKEYFLDQIIIELNIKRKIPVTVNELIIFPANCASILVTEPGRIWSQSIKWFKEENKIIWCFFDEEALNEFILKNEKFYLSEVSDLESILQTYSDINSHSDFIRKIAESIILKLPSLNDSDTPMLGVTKDEIYEFLSGRLPGINIDEQFLFEFYKAIAAIVKLKAVNYDTIALALEHFYPKTELLHLEDRELKKMILQLPNFINEDDKVDNDILTAVMTCWLQYRDSDRNGDFWS